MRRVFEDWDKLRLQLVAHIAEIRKRLQRISLLTFRQGTPRRRHLTQRTYGRFAIGPNSHPSKVQRWLARGGGANLVLTLEEMVAAHIHPRHMRAGR